MRRLRSLPTIGGCSSRKAAAKESCFTARKARSPPWSWNCSGPGDSLGLLGLLPPKPVAVGEKWSPASWVGQMLTDTEAAAKSDLNCTLESVTQGEAKVTLEGTVEGATAGSSGKST